jgi:hypothetical protein
MGERMRQEQDELTARRFSNAQPTNSKRNP